MDNAPQARYDRAPMFRNMVKILLTIVFLLTSGLMMLSAQSDNGAGDLFYKGYTLKTEAEKLEQSGDTAGAIAKYQQAQQAIGAVAQNYPAWQPEVVNYRLRLIEHAIAKLRGQTGAAPLAGVPAPLPPSPGYSPAAPSFAPPAAVGGAINPLDMVNQQIQALQRENADYKEKLRVYEDSYTNASRDRQRAMQEASLLQQQLQELNAKAEALSQELQAKDSNARQELDKIREEAKMVAGMLASRNEQLEESGKTIEALQKEKDDLIARNSALEQDLSAVSKGKGQGKTGDVSKLAADNKRLHQELENARKQIETLKAEGVKKDQEVAALRAQITGIQDELTRLRQENTSYQGQVAELTRQLKEVNAQIADGAPANAQNSVELGRKTAENVALRNIIMRHLRQQNRLLQSKEIVIAEMKKLEGASKVLMENLEDMTSGKIRVTVDEESLFSEPELKEILSASEGGVYATLEAPSSAPGHPATVAAAKTDSAFDLSAPTTSTEESLMNQAADALRAADYKTADWAYQEALRANPKNTLALNNLAGIKLHTSQFEEAEVLLQKSLVYQPENDTALYRLGVCYFQQDKLPDAQTSFEKSLSINKNSARAHHYLGIITTRQGNRSRAETEFKSALAIDPGYGDAHFNLAVLYATATPPDWDLARKHYKDALDHGIKADPAMEKLLQNPESLSSTPENAVPAAAQAATASAQ